MGITLLTRGPWHPRHQHAGPPIDLICLDAATHIGPDGCALAESRPFDEQGLIGRATRSVMIRKMD
ncbi:MAG: hypothetical protein HY847_12320 [Betaproteobacteria bacterium]|nr:hypothetical protein [Betaproteobacteria bacterium]